MIPVFLPPVIQPMRSRSRRGVSFFQPMTRKARREVYARSTPRAACTRKYPNGSYWEECQAWSRILYSIAWWKTTNKGAMANDSVVGMPRAASRRSSTQRRLNRTQPRDRKNSASVRRSHVLPGNMTRSGEHGGKSAMVKVTKGHSTNAVSRCFLVTWPRLTSSGLRFRAAIGSAANLSRKTAKERNDSVSWHGSWTRGKSPLL